MASPMPEDRCPGVPGFPPPLKGREIRAGISIAVLQTHLDQFQESLI